MSSEKRHEIGLKGRKHVLQNYGFENFQQTWVDYMLQIHEEEGSWATRTGYCNITFKEVA
jgi:hypothetical protein